MRPAFSVVFLTTLIGAGQGLFLALYAAELQHFLHGIPDTARPLLVSGSVVAIVLAALGLLASFFHLGRPERAWRSAAKWRTSWLSREVIALPLFMAVTAAYGFAVFDEWPGRFVLATIALICCFTLFYCTAMIYACVKFLQEWASPYTFPNFILMGCASGFTLAAAMAAILAPRLAVPYSAAAIVFTIAALFTRLASLSRNARIRPKSTLQSAIGVNDPKVRQISQGFTGSSFNTIEFFHGATPQGMRQIRLAFLALAFIVPVILIVGGFVARSPGLFALAFAVQYAGLVLERWYFLADANHPQNLYYQNKA